MNTDLYVNYSRQRPKNRVHMCAKNIHKFIGDYLYYRKLKLSHKAACSMARNTI